MPTRDFQDLIVWQRAMTLMRGSYRIAARLPIEERFAMSAQIRRAASSIPANIAEGHSSPHRREFIRYLGIAQSSLKELERHLLMAVQVDYLSRDDIAPCLALSDEVSRMLRAMRRSLGEVVSTANRSAPLAPRAGGALPTRLDDQLSARRNRSQS